MIVKNRKEPPKFLKTWRFFSITCQYMTYYIVVIVGYIYIINVL